MNFEMKWLMKFSKVIAVCCAMTASIMVRAGEAGSFVLTKDGKPACSIVVDPNGTKSARFGACELQWHIKEMTGVNIPIVNAPTQVPAIYVGDSQSLRTAESFDTEDFKSQEYRVSVNQDRIILAGKDHGDRGKFTYNMDNPLKFTSFPDMWKSNGSLYAVYDFLERCGGVRWFNQTESGTFIPKTENLVVSGKELRRKPAFIYRNAFYPANPTSYDSYNFYTALWKRTSPQYKEWAAMAFSKLHARYKDPKQYAKARGNLTGLFLLRSRCGGERMDCNHSFYGYYDRFWKKNPKKPGLFEESHPEYFAHGYNPNSVPPNLCYTNSELVKQVAKDARDYYDGIKTGWQLSIFWSPQLPNPFPIEAMDGGGFCKCEECSKLIKAGKERGRSGFDSDYFFNFVNECCKELKKTHPDKEVITLAYMTHARIPTFPLDPGVNVQYCFTGNRMPYRSSYKSQLRELEEWAAERKLSGRQLGLWLYYTFPVEMANKGGFHCFPGFFAHTIDKQMKIFQKCGVYGMFHCGYGQEVEAYVTFRMMNDPSLSIDVLLDEYFTNMYGNAASAMKELYCKIEDTYCNPESYLSKVKVFDILDKGADGTAPFKISDLNSLGICVTQVVRGNWKNRVSRFANIKVCEINEDGSDGKELMNEQFNEGLQDKWLSDSNFEQGKDSDKSVIELPWNKKKGILVSKLPEKPLKNGIRVYWDHRADGWDFFRQWHVMLTTGASLDALSGYDVTYRRNGNNAKPFMDILKITKTMPGEKSGSLFKLYGNEKISSWGQVTPAKNVKPSSLMVDQDLVRGEWTRFQLDVTPEQDGTRLCLYRQSAAPDSKKIVGHQTAQIAWGILGTEERMNELQKIMRQAEESASTEQDKHRVALFKKSVWEYMTTGALQYRGRTKAALQSIKAPAVKDANGNVKLVDWAKAAPIGDKWFKKGTGVRSSKNLSGRICHDSKFLYLELSDRCNTAKLVTSAGVFPYDDWEIFVARQRALPYRQYAVGPTGKCVGLSHGEVNWRMNVPLDENPVKIVSDTRSPDIWTVRLAFPLDGMTNGTLKKGDKFYMNVTRISSPSLANGCDIDSWVSFCTVGEIDRLTEITLE